MLPSVGSLPWSPVISSKSSSDHILNNFSIEINKGEVHAIMGPNGSGKSTFSHILAGKEDYDVTSGEITIDGINVKDISGQSGLA